MKGTMPKTPRKGGSHGKSVRRATSVNLKDVARAAGVDPSLVSRVLRDDPWPVRAETRKRILEAARELDYRPNALARSLKTRRTGNIGLVIASLDNLGFADVTHGIQRAAAEAGRLVLVLEADALPDDGSGPSKSVTSRIVEEGWVDGLILAYATLQDRYLARLVEQRIPLVLVNRRAPGVSGAVVVDDTLGARMAIAHLAELGHRRIGYVGIDIEADTARRRHQGYRDGLAAAGLDERAGDVQDAPASIEGGYDAVQRFLAAATEQPVTAIFVASLMAALGARTALAEHGLRVPEDISLIAFNDHPIAEHLQPPLTTVRMPNLEMGREAVRMLLGALEGEPVSDRMVDVPPRIVVRGTTARLQGGAARSKGLSG
jgi:LacI family transcriptional regulator